MEKADRLQYSIICARYNPARLVNVLRSKLTMTCPASTKIAVEWIHFSCTDLVHATRTVKY